MGRHAEAGFNSAHGAGFSSDTLIEKSLGKTRMLLVSKYLRTLTLIIIIVAVIMRIRVLSFYNEGNPRYILVAILAS